MNLPFLDLRRGLRLAAAFAAIAAAAAVVVVAASFAVYAAAKPYVGEAWAAAIVAAVFALTAVVVAWLATRKVVPKAPKAAKGAPVEDATLIDKVIDMAKERPLIAVGAAAVAGVVLWRNPALVAALVSAFVAGDAAKPDSKK